jgi:CRISPR/Cas system-associated exonuclease Cas4 (RecB family)
MHLNAKDYLMTTSQNNLLSKIPKGFSFSQSSLQDYSDCARRFQLRYVEQLRWPAAETEPVLDYERHQIEGKAFHRLIQQHLLGLPVEKLSHLADKSKLNLWWKNFTASNLNINGYAQFTESTLSCPVGDYRLIAKYDLIAIQPLLKAMIFDWKTYSKRPRNEWMASRWQTRIYQAVLAKAGAQLNNGHPIEIDQIEMIYWYADFPSEPARFAYNSGQFKLDWSVIEKVVNEISSAKEFPMVDDENTCRFCIYRSFCERGKQAGGLNEAEDDLESDSAFDINFEQIGEIEF